MAVTRHNSQRRPDPAALLDVDVDRLAETRALFPRHVQKKLGPQLHAFAQRPDRRRADATEYESRAPPPRVRADAFDCKAPRSDRRDDTFVSRLPAVESRSYRDTDHLRVLIANERKDRLALVAPIVVALGHEVIAREIDVAEVGPVTARERPDVALVGLGANSTHALDLIDKIVRAAACPVIALLHSPDAAFVKEASKRGVFAHITDNDVEEWQSSIDIVLRRFAEYHDLEGAFGRRAQIERAKGILMERHSITEGDAFDMLRHQSRVANRKLIDLAAAVVDGHQLLPKTPSVGLA
jgi:AmiR/NasT family two-component response regulator